MRMLALMFSCALIMGGPSGEPPKHLPNLEAELADLASPAKTDDARLRLISRASCDSRVYALLSDRLPAMLIHDTDFSVVRNEAELAGLLKLSSTIPAPIRLLNYPQYAIGGGSMSSQMNLTSDPVAKALYEIGEPALPDLVEALKSNSFDVRDRVEAILVLTNTTESRAILKGFLPHEPDPRLRARIESVVSGK